MEFPKMCGSEKFHYETRVRHCADRNRILSPPGGEVAVPETATDIFTFVTMVLNAELDKATGLDVGIDKLYPAVVECFVVILLGYIAGKAGIITQSETKGLNSFIGKFSLPSLIFLSLAELDLSCVNWWFLLAILAAKSVVFFSVILISVLVSKGGKLDKAGLFAIFCTQSNDFALGYPIIRALYDDTHPEYASYLYLVAPVNLIFLNPIAFVLMEISKQKDLEKLQMMESDDGKGRYERPNLIVVVKRVMKGILMNPVIIMTALGICGNLAFKHCVPTILEGILKVLGSAFSASALFSLGLTMVGSAASLKGSGFLVPGILISIKLLVLPIVTREMVSVFRAGINANDTASLSNFGFLYGTFPSAPGVFVYATHYDVATQMIASAMVACTFVSAPLMFVSAKMTTIHKLDPKDYVHDLDAFLQNISILAFVACMWVIAVFVLSRKWRKVPHCFTMCLVVSQSIACIGAILWSWLGVDWGADGGWKLYLQFAFLQFGIFSSRIFTAILAASLVFLRCRSLCFVLRLRPYMCLLGWGVPAVLVTILMLTVKRETLYEKQDPIFQYGVTQALVAVMLLMMCLIVTIGCLVMQQRYERQYAQYHTLPTHQHHSDEETLPRRSWRKRNDSLQSRISRPSTSIAPQIRARTRSVSCSGCTKLDDNPGPSASRPQITVTEIEDLKTSDHEIDYDDDESLFSFNDDLCAPSKHPCDPVQRRYCASLLERYRQSNYLTEPEEIGIVRDRDDEFQMIRHIVLLLLLCCSMFVGIALCVWTLIMEDVTGIYVELVFLDAALNFGQGFFTFMLFGLNTRLIIMPLHKWWRRIVYGEGMVKLPAWDELSLETRNTCEQFLAYHSDKCMQDIVRDRRWRMESYSQVFCGSELVDWLIMVGLAKDRVEAIKYGRHLLNGRVIRHVKGLHHFHDQPFFYTFLPPPDSQDQDR